MNHTKSLEHEPISPVNFGDYRRLNAVFEDAAAWWRPQINLADDSGEPVRVNSIETTENLFAVLGVRPYLGQSFTIHPQLYGPQHEAVISYRLWQSRFNGDRAIVGNRQRGLSEEQPVWEMDRSVCNRERSGGQLDNPR